MEQSLNNIQLHDDWGVYVSEDDEDEVTELTEGIDGYIVRVEVPGPPCYPVTIGGLIQGGGKSYRIEHKLGHGAFSTVWLAFEVGTGTSVALKIHRTLTTAVACFHAHNLIHRDINDNNVMLGIVPGALDQGPTPSERYNQVGRPQKFPLPTCEWIWRPGDLVAPIGWPSNMVAKTAFLSDFGLSMRAGSPITDDCLPPLPCVSPELFHEGFGPTYESDMWGFMCVFATLMTSSSLFDGWSAPGPLGCMARVIGPLPREWDGRYKWPRLYSEEERRKWYDQSRTADYPFEALLGLSREDLKGSREQELVSDVLHKGFKYQPSERITAQQLLDDAPFQELMSIHGIE
ncbi:hypothetical protein J7T55_005184 [Diaporthe amygdali]|uniref:uncharacterized protein n=1 Tax=Phomopsis amygdali TaxID=1214568 RepID=UPI0022FE4CD2|nr:uncharacterized protein J7T55_005184 [Diaporthe amygdali]KAJ0116238.1 hypothetical protein J7T55_005184 [Diaporthe amygdali]